MRTRCRYLYRPVELNRAYGKTVIDGLGRCRHLQDVGGQLRFRLPEGGVIKMEKTETVTKTSHNVSIDLPDWL
jgi:hypothetical protein